MAEEEVKKYWRAVKETGERGSQRALAKLGEAGGLSSRVENVEWRRKLEAQAETFARRLALVQAAALELNGALEKEYAKRAAMRIGREQRAKEMGRLEDRWERFKNL